MAIATLLQAYCHVSDHEAIERAVMDTRWQVVLHRLDCEAPPSSQATLVHVRQRMIAYHWEKERLDRTVAVAEAYGGFGPRPLRALVDSSP
ncbi:MAG: transposase [Candidatus Tectomicrobia bacterium]|nr:transposase [Candidatus Tectomicrobia bacterium]